MKPTSGSIAAFRSANSSGERLSTKASSSMSRNSARSTGPFFCFSQDMAANSLPRNYDCRRSALSKWLLQPKLTSLREETFFTHLKNRRNALHGKKWRNKSLWTLKGSDSGTPRLINQPSQTQSPGGSPHINASQFTNECMGGDERQESDDYAKLMLDCSLMAGAWNPRGFEIEEFFFISFSSKNVSEMFFFFLSKLHLIYCHQSIS